jgi:Domain of unknown function (DUF6894)
MGAGRSLVRRGEAMPMYYFDLRGHGTIADTEGTDLPDRKAAHQHATVVARELMARSTGLLEQNWSTWMMCVHDGKGTEQFSFAMAES